MVLLISLTALTTIRTWATLTTIVMIRTWTTFSAFWTLTTTLLWFYVSLWLFYENTVRKLELTSLWVNLQKFDTNLVTLLNASLLNSLKALPVNL
jgi:hypothetical protein